MITSAANEYSRVMVELLDERKLIVAPTAFQGAFFGRPETGAKTVFSLDTKSIEIDIVRSTGNTLAQLVNRGTSSGDTTRIKTQTEDKFTNIARAWPLIETLGSINSSQLLDRMPGENPYALQAKEDRMAGKALDIHEEGIRQHITTTEYLAREALLTGQHPAILNTSNSNLIYDFYRNAANFIAVATAWTDVAADISGNLDAGIDEIQQNAFLHGEYGCIMAADAFAGFKKNTTIKSDADNRRFLFVELGGKMVELPTEFMKYKENGFAPRGYLETDKGRRVWVFTYDLTFQDTFTNPAVSTTTDWMPSGTALLFHPKARCDRYFGPSDTLPVTDSKARWYMETFGFNMANPPMPPNVQNTSVIDSRMFHCDAYKGPDDKAVVIRTQSAPIMPTTQTDAFVTLSGLV